MLDLLGEANTAALLGLAGGVALGLAARVGRFCTLGAIEDFLYSSDDRRLRMWGVAIGVAIMGVHLSMALGAFAPSATVYLDRHWAPVATVLGGLAFGYGMALAGNCGYGALARLGGGDLRSFVILLVMGVSAHFVLSGPLAEARIAVFPVETGAAGAQGFAALAASLLGAAPAATGLVLGGLLVAAALADRRMLRSPGHASWGAAVGLAVVSGWLGTTWIAGAGFGVEPVESHTFAAPIGETILFAMTASGSALSFGIGSVCGVVAGAFAGALAKGQFRWEACEDARELRRQVGGAALMGAGAALATGCSVGQGISAFSVLAYSAPVALLSIFAGAAFGLRQMIAGVFPAE